MDSPRIRQMMGSAIPANTRKTSISNVHRIARGECCVAAAVTNALLFYC